MKNILKYMFAGLVACGTLASCNPDSLDTAPTDSMSGSDLLANANSALVPLNGIYRSMFTAWSPQGNTHQCFGISAYSMMADVMGEDFIMAAPGSGWFWYDCIYQVKKRYTSNAWRSYDLWNAYYKWVSNANYILSANETMEGTEADKNYVMGQAYVIRAYSYFMLAQSFARTYKGHESEPCCPIYTEPTVAGTEGAARSTVQEVYDQILKDLNEGLNLLKDTKRKHITHMGYEVALGLQARIALVMENWELAKTSAHEAIKVSGTKAIKPEDFAGLNNAKAKNVIWGAEIIPDQSGMYASLFAHMSPEVSYGKSALKQISKDLYAKMNATDARTAWWLPNDPSNKKGGYLQNKFQFKDIQTWTGDYIWMRAEEMYLTAAEAECRLGDEKAALDDLKAVMSLRDPKYVCEKTGTALGKLTNEQTGSLLEEILIQRRIELWGEFGRVYDIRRLKQGFVRSEEMGYPKDALLENRPTTDPENFMWVMTIPQSEFDGNINMDPVKDQNPLGDTK